MISKFNPIQSGQVFETNLFINGTNSNVNKFDPENFSDSSRTVSFFVPNSLIGVRNLPLLIAFHGSTEDGEIFRSRTTGFGYDQLASQEGFIVAYPTGYKGNWNDSRRAVNYPAKVENINDIAFTKAIIDFAHKRWSTSLAKTLIAGYSNGGHMCYRLALELGSSLISGVAIHCANLPTSDNSDCIPIQSDAIPICIINGTADPVNPWIGGVVSFGNQKGTVGGRGTHRSSIETIDYFANRYLETGEELEIEEIEEGEIMDLKQFRSTTDGRLKVQLIAMIGEGHYVPIAAGEKKALVIGPRRGAVHAPRLAIEFFKEATNVFHKSHCHRHRTDSDFSDASL
ncbi:Alpha/Beta hydrolase protein [Melampsora americana]|nr:Alpha/Beta hydrolase protein [Melampsora americana]